MSARILVVDDLEQNIRLLEAKLSKEYYAVITATSGEEALDILSKTNIDLVLLDVMMPVMDGIETCKRMKADLRFANIAVVMITALGEKQHRISSLKAGADDFITKPIMDSALFARIRSLVRMKKMIEEILNRFSSDMANLINEDDLHKQILLSKILVIDDDVTQNFLLKRIFENLTSNIQFYSDMSENLDDYLGKQYDLIIVSSQLSDEDGLRICSLVLNNDKCRDIPVLITADEADQQLIIKSLEIGVADYLCIPLDENEAVARVYNQIKRKKLQDFLKCNVEKNMTLASTDQLTGLNNRFFFDNRAKFLLSEAIENETSLAFMIMDIDHFKKVNDTYGHLVGDEVLKEVTKRIKSIVRTSDLLARFGGEEFVLMMPHATENDAKMVAERILKKVSEKPISINHEIKEINKTISIGITELKRKSDSIEDLISRSDKALYYAKENGRNMVIIAKDNK